MILNECSFLDEGQIKNIEEKHNAKYVFETCLKGYNGAWINAPAAIFYSKVPHPMGSNYFAFYRGDSKLNYMICDAKEHIDGDFQGIKALNGDIIYSRFRHDFRNSPDGSVFIDGGRDYTRWGGKGDLVSFKVQEDKLVIN